MFILGLGTAHPPHHYSQMQCWEALQASRQFAQLDPRSQAILRKVLRSPSGIQGRYLAFDRLEEAFELTPQAMHDRFARHAPAVASAAAQHALAHARVDPEAIDALIISTCTGYLCPGLTSYVSERLALRSDLMALDLVGQGCGAAMPNLRTAAALLASGECRRVLSVCVEICSAAFYLDGDPGVLISACLFGDGAGAAVLGSEPTPLPEGRLLRWAGFKTVLNPADRDYLRFESKNGMLRNILTQQVPGLAAKYAENVLAEMLTAAGRQKEEVTGWILHPGGREILASLRERLGLEPQATASSDTVLQHHGNLSSASLFFVLREALRTGVGPGYWWLSSFGAGFTCHGAWLKVE